MTDSSYSFENNQLIGELARNLNLATPEYPDLPAAERKIDRETIENLFDILLKRIILQRELYIPIPKLTYQQQASNIFDKIAPTLWIKLSAIGATFFIVAAITLGLFNPTATVPIRIYIYLFGFFGLLFAILWEVRWLRQISLKQGFQTPEETARSAFEKAKFQATSYERKMIEEIVEVAQFSKEALQYVENKIQLELDIQIQNINLMNKTIRIFAVLIVLGFFYTFTPFQLLLNSILGGNGAILNSIVIVLSVLGAGLILFTEWLNNTLLQWKITSYKICLYVLKQAQLLIVSGGAG